MGQTRTIQQRTWWQTALFLALVPLILLLVVLALPIYLVWTVGLHLMVWLLWCARGRDILFVYSDSPLWHDYVETQILPHIRQRAIILNWSQRRQWKFSLARAVFYHFGQTREFNPLAVVFKPFRRTRTFRFWAAFQDLKHERPQSLRKMENEFFDCAGILRSLPSD